VGAEFLTATGGAGSVGGYYHEVEVLEAKGYLCVGFAGTCLGQRCALVGGDACSWGLLDNGDGCHGCAAAPAPRLPHGDGYHGCAAAPAPRLPHGDGCHGCAAAPAPRLPHGDGCHGCARYPCP
jgi:hypothetical protein